MIKNRKELPQENPYQDTARSWVVSVACAWNFFWLTLINRSSGILFVAILDTFSLNRQEASWAFSLMDTLASFTVIICSFLYKVLDTRPISLVGSTLIAGTCIFCFLVFEVQVITVVLGTVIGIGQGMMYFTNTIVINQYFKKNRASGNGIYFAGGTFSSFFFPPVLFSIIRSYGLRTTLLFLGGMALHAIPGSLLLESPFTRIKKIQRRRALSSIQVANTPETTKLAEQKHNTLDEETTFKIPVEWVRKQLAEFVFLKRPIFHVIVFTGVAFSFSFVIYPVTIVDFAITRGITRDQSALLLTTFSTGDLTGRLFAGIVTDSRMLQRDHMMVMVYAAWSATFLALPLCEGYAIMVVVTIALGVAVGSGTILNTVLLADYLGIKSLPMTFAMYRLLLGVISLARPLCIGYFRDKVGSYDGLYFVIGAYSFIVSLAWAVVSLIRLTRVTKKYSLK